MKYSIIIPAYNEEKRIRSTILKILGFFQRHGCDFEIVVVNDCSEDNTSQVVKNIKNKNVRLLEHKPNYGKGFAVKKGMLGAKGDILLFSDADLSTPIVEFDNFIKYIGEFGVVIGSRSIKGANVLRHQPFYRELMGKIFNKFVRLFAVRGIIDTQCGFKMFTRKSAQDIFKRTRIYGFGFDVEVLFLARKFGYNIKELPVTWINEENSKVSPVKDAVKMFFEIIKIRFNDLMGYYN